MGNFQFQSKQHTMQKSKGFSNFCRVRRLKNFTRSYNRKALAVPKNQPNASVGTIIRGGSINIYFEEARGRSFPIEDRRGMCQWGVRAIILKINEGSIGQFLASAWGGTRVFMYYLIAIPPNRPGCCKENPHVMHSAPLNNV